MEAPPIPRRGILISDFTITEVLGQEPFQTEHGSFVAYEVRFEGEEGKGVAQHNRKSSSPMPTIGEVIDAEIVHKGDKTTLKRIWKPAGVGASNNSGGGYSENPKKSAEIRRMAAQKAGVELLSIEVRIGLSGFDQGQNFLKSLSEPGGVSKALAKRIEWFEHDARKAGESV